MTFLAIGTKEMGILSIMTIRQKNLLMLIKPHEEPENSTESKSFFRQLSDKFNHSEQVEPETDTPI